MVTLWLCFKASPRAKHENEFDFTENESEGGKHFPMNHFVRMIVQTQRQLRRKWPIYFRRE